MKGLIFPFLMTGLMESYICFRVTVLVESYVYYKFVKLQLLYSYI